VGKIPYDIVITRAMVNEKSVIEFSDGHLSKCIIDMWREIKGKLEE